MKSCICYDQLRKLIYKIQIANTISDGDGDSWLDARMDRQMEQAKERLYAKEDVDQIWLNMKVVTEKI